MLLLLKFTQALGNSFQLHVPDGTIHSRWKAKPESWYYFEPGLITCGVKPGVWDAYRTAVMALEADIQREAAAVGSGTKTYEQAKASIDVLVKKYDPWQYVNIVRVEKGTLIDLSPCGIHHSWEEDLATIPLGNVLYEIQVNVMDDVATLRSFDKGKMSKDGILRPLTIDEYFTYADRSPTANDPKTHMRQATLVRRTNQFTHERLLHSKYYTMDKVTIAAAGTSFTDTINTFRHLYVKTGSVVVTSGHISVHASAGHSLFVPMGCRTYEARAKTSQTELLISY